MSEQAPNNEQAPQPTPEQIEAAKKAYTEQLSNAVGEYFVKEFKIGEWVVVNDSVSPLKRGKLGVIVEKLEKPINMLERLNGLELTSGIAPSVYDYVAMFIDQSNGMPVTWCIDSRDYKLYSKESQ